jgi:hypothetical protein
MPAIVVRRTPPERTKGKVIPLRPLVKEAGVGKSAAELAQGCGQGLKITGGGGLKLHPLAA